MNRFFRIICALVGLGTASCEQKAYVELSAKQFGQLIQSTPNIQLVDVRTEEEYRKSRLEHAVLIDINKPEFKQQAKTIPLLYIVAEDGVLQKLRPFWQKPVTR